MLRVLFDLQALQNESGRRGIGRYVRDFFAALSERDDLELVGLLNHAFPDTLHDLRAEAARLVGKENVLVWHGLQRSAERQAENASRAQLNRQIYEDFLANLEFDVLLVGSLFDGHADDTAVSLGGEGSYLRTVIHYDLIPLLNPKDFFWDENYHRFYEERLEQLTGADVLFAISDATALEAEQNLPRGDRRIVTIGAAINHHFFNKDLPVDGALIKSLGITRPYVLHVSSLEPRKNFDGLIRGFSKLPKKIRDKHQLVLVGNAHPGYAALLRAEAAKHGLGTGQLVILSGLSDDAVAQLYRAAALFCFPSLHEGFGLPALEAMASGCPTVGSDRSSIPEVIGDKDLLFNPDDENDIARAMRRLLSNRAEASRVAHYGVERATSFTWAGVAARFSEALQPLKRPRQRAGPPSLTRSVARLIDSSTAPPADDDALALARAVVANFDAVMEFRGRPASGAAREWRVEGPFDSSYSLALLNRETARSLEEKGYATSLRSMKDPGNSTVDETYLERHGDLQRMHARFVANGIDPAAIVSRNNYPPLVDDMVGQVRALHHYAWEESGFPSRWVDGFNTHLTMMTCLSQHVRKIMIDNGVSVPMLVSGCGVDHWERIVPDENYRIEAPGFRFLHVSSCFPRKGVEALIEAFGIAFSANDDVSLIIKTFDNPHNEVEGILAKWRAKRPDFPNVVTIFADLTDEQLKALYGQCDVMVGPSFAEGYGLPLAEAMLSGIPVITTAWGGQLDFCNDGNSWLVDYRFERAQSHFGLWASAWARVDLQSLVRALLSAFRTSPETRTAMARRGRRQLLAEHKWSDITDRLSVAAQALPSIARRPVRLGWISTWNSKCGIATYSAHLIEQLDCDVQVFSPKNEEALDETDSSLRSWRTSKEESGLGEILNLPAAENVDVFVIQFNFGFYNHVDLGTFIRQARRKGKRIVIFLHATHHPGDQFAPGAEKFHLRHMIPTLRDCDRLLVHSIDDLNRLKALGLVDNVALFPHGVVRLKPSSTTIQPLRRTVGTYGFALPHKGLSETVRAIHLLRSRGADIDLRMTNAEYPAPVSTAYVTELKELISELGLDRVVDFCSEFLTDDQAAARMRSTDLIVFPYQNTEESASGAVRYGMAMQKPVMVSPNPIFSDLSGATFLCASATPEGIADGIMEALDEIEAGSDRASEIAARAASWRDEHAYEQLGRRLTGMCQSLANQY
jgi:glycosyltransferase involved in cell wall biosynthesis